MDKKIKQITDIIHEAIYLSEIEVALTSTPYFYRLHDIYQTSTVYMTFPSNRTKRYEHSLGTMEIASRMLFFSISNAKKETRKKLFEELYKQYVEIVKLIFNPAKNQPINYWSENTKDIFKDIVDQNILNEKNFLNDFKNKEINSAVSDDFFSDSALDHFQFYPMIINNEDESGNTINYFLYRCLLQAVRIVALFHDVGHPPYSHIIEKVLEMLYKEYSDKKDEWDRKKGEDLEKYLKPYATEIANEVYTCHTIDEQKLSKESKLHERIGFSMLESALKDIVKSKISLLVESDKKNYCKTSGILYYTMIVEFTIAILSEKNSFFQSFHKIVDGVFDADRLDYIMRDSLNSGIDWGQIPYKRLLNSAKLIHISDNQKNFFVIAYPHKLAEDIADILVIRYKIFARINFHHSCKKTAFSLQSSVLMLARDFLKTSEDSNCINPDIQTLWMGLGTISDIKERQIIRWNDSWLISTLHKALTTLQNSLSREKEHMPGSRNEMEETLKETLEEILLNKKRYYSVFKHGQDSQKFVEKVFYYAQLSSGKLQNMKKDICKDLITAAGNNYTNYKNKLTYIEALLEAEQTKELEKLQHIFDLCQKNIKEIIDNVLAAMKENNELKEYETILHEERENMGLPSHNSPLDEIYLYKNNDDKFYIFDEKISLKPHLEAVKRDTLWFYIYVIPNPTCKDIQELLMNIFNKIAENVGGILKNLVSIKLEDLK